MRREYVCASIFFIIMCGALSCAQKVEIGSQTQPPQAQPRPFTTPEAQASPDETLQRHIANMTIKRDERGHIVGLFDVESYVNDDQLCKVKKDVIRLSEFNRTGTVVTGLMFELPNTSRFELLLEGRLKELYEAERNEFELFFSKERKFRATLHQCLAPCQDSRDVIDIEQF